MKKIGIIGVAMLWALGCAQNSQSPRISNEDLTNQLLVSQLHSDQLRAAFDLINWKVGDYQKHSLELMGAGSMDKEVTGEEGDGVWLTTKMSIMGQAQEQKALIDRKTGKVLKVIVNGQEQPTNSDQKIDILDQHSETVTVPAGTFDTHYIKAKVTSQGQSSIVQMWMNMDKVNIDGQVQMKAEIMSGFELTAKLLSFGTH